MNNVKALPTYIFKNGNELDNDLFAIGMNVAPTKISIDPNIEETLLSASVESVVDNNGRTAGLLVDWLSIHYQRINMDRLTTLVTSLDIERYRWVKIFWCANAQRLVRKDIRFKKISALYANERFDYVDRFLEPKKKSFTEMYLSMKGEDERFKGTCLRIPKGAFSHRPQQIFSAQRISRTHMGFRYRIMFGPSYRADVWALLRRNPDLTGGRLARLAHCSRPCATRVKHDYEIVKRDYSSRSQAA